MGKQLHTQKPPTAKSEMPPLRALLQRSGLPADSLCQELPTGFPNRVFHVRSSAGDFALKWYGQQRGATARFLTEQAFYELLRPFASQRLPEPLLWHASERFALFKWVDGVRLTRDDLQTPLCADLLAFLSALNRARPAAAGRAFPPAAGACFSLHERLEAVGRLVQQTVSGLAIGKFAKGLTTRLEPAWQLVSQVVLQRAEKAGLNPEQTVPLQSRMLSAPDWGLHQALRTSSGHLVFFDFDGAGWDDPAWWLAGVFSQWELPLPLNLWEAFVPAAVRLLGAESATLQRTALLLPVSRFQQICPPLLQAPQPAPPAAARRQTRQAADAALHDLAHPQWWRG
ncbi:MAG: aminoglycoside phosphotransferase family protein [Verrucomicrobiae bacterium]|nr:aminoglycoside phosphotransferase family protein [Verrucomicrobiae bacterium]